MIQTQLLMGDKNGFQVKTSSITNLPKAWERKTSSCTQSFQPKPKQCKETAVNKRNHILSMQTCTMQLGNGNLNP
jgi:hypothetical protein